MTGNWRIRRCFARRLDAMPAILAFLDDALPADGASAGERHALEFAIEELFTNLVKYNAQGSGDIEIELEGDAHQVIGRMCDPDSDRFDITATPDADVDVPAELRQPGGLGLHLLRRMVDHVEYAHDGRRSLVTFRKTRQRG